MKKTTLKLAVITSTLMFSASAMAVGLGVNTGVGKDHTIFAKTDGIVSFAVRGANNRKFIDIVPAPAEG